LKRRLPSLSSQQVERALRRAGFEIASKRGKGSHRAYTRIDATGVRRLVIVPMGKDIPRGTIRAILEQAGLDEEELLSPLIQSVAPRRHAGLHLSIDRSQAQ
jgi:predicted RNA binding protein YcfA (HicA-like mRNA interferase family)